MISMDPRVGIFITMNPGYAGRTELPESVKALFRPVVVIVPDMQQICEIMLFSEGFLMAKVMHRGHHHRHHYHNHHIIGWHVRRLCRQLTFADLCLHFQNVVTHSDESGGSKAAFIRVCLCVGLFVCPHDRTKTA